MICGSIWESGAVSESRLYSFRIKINRNIDVLV